MAILKLAMTILGAVAILFGLLFIGQGLGWVRWPSSSFMIDDTSWSIRGAALVVGGALMAFFGGRLRR